MPNFSVVMSLVVSSMTGVIRPVRRKSPKTQKTQNTRLTHFCTELCLLPSSQVNPPPPQKKTWGLDKALDVISRKCF